jgi:hypothetical protein
MYDDKLIISSCSFAGIFIVSFLHRELPPNLTSQPFLFFLLHQLQDLKPTVFALIPHLLTYNGFLFLLFSPLFSGQASMGAFQFLTKESMRKCFFTASFFIEATLLLLPLLIWVFFFTLNLSSSLS